MAEEVYWRIGRNIREHRKARGWALQHLARVLGISYQQVQKYESGANRLPAHMLILLAKEFECTSDELCGLKAAPSAPEAGQLLQRFNRVSSSELRQKIVELVGAATE